MNTLTEILLADETDLIDSSDLKHKLVVHNDEVNSFDWVIETLVEVCKHSFQQAEQCSLIIHHKGKYAVKHGTLFSLKTMKDAISERGIQVTIEEN
jgi:ATP-dependent Clp protease adaptor protein ClpS